MDERSVGVFSNRYLLGGIAFALAFAVALIYIPALNSLFGTASLTAGQLATVLPFPFIVWGADEFRRLLVRHRATNRRTAGGTGRSGPKAGDFQPERPCRKSRHKVIIELENCGRRSAEPDAGRNRKWLG